MMDDSVNKSIKRHRKALHKRKILPLQKTIDETEKEINITKRKLSMLKNRVALTKRNILLLDSGIDITNTMVKLPGADTYYRIHSVDMNSATYSGETRYSLYINVPNFHSKILGGVFTSSQLRLLDKKDI